MKVQLTDTIVGGLTCSEGAKDSVVFDDALPGFCVRITSKGKKVFGFRYKRAGATKHLVLGPWPELTAAQARKRAGQERGKVLAGADPFSERKATEAQEKAERQRIAFSVRAAITQWGAKHLAQRSAAYRTQSEGALTKALARHLDKPAADITKADVIAALDAARKGRGPVAANRLHSAGHACWKFAIGRDDLESNPWGNVPKPAKETARDRWLKDDEIVAVWQAAETLPRTWRSMVRLLLLTAQRRSEVAGMRWSELDDASWTIPRERAKNGVAHLVPLSPAAVEIIQAQPRAEGATFVFQNRRESSPSGFSKMKAALDRATGARVAAWTLHDLRRTAATGMQRLGVMPVVIEAALNHVSGTRSGIAGVYQRFQYEAERRDALDRWASHVTGLVATAEKAEKPRTAGRPEGSKHTHDWDILRALDSAPEKSDRMIARGLLAEAVAANDGRPVMEGEEVRWAKRVERVRKDLKETGETARARLDSIAADELDWDILRALDSAPEQSDRTIARALLAEAIAANDARPVMDGEEVRWAKRVERVRRDLKESGETARARLDGIVTDAFADAD